jgi:hypothetical protein
MAKYGKNLSEYRKMSLDDLYDSLDFYNERLKSPHMTKQMRGTSLRIKARIHQAIIEKIKKGKAV